MIDNSISVDYDAKTKRLHMAVGFHLADVARGYPSRRFIPKSKKWAMPIIRTNINHLNETRHIYDYRLTELAEDAVKNFQKLSEGPKYIPFPYYAYDFTDCEKKFPPMEHQRKMLDKVWNLPAAAWFAKMGTGKTYAAIHLAAARFKAGLIDSVVVVAPSTLRTVWKKEFAKFSTVPYDFRTHESKARWYAEFCKEQTPGEMKILAVSVEGLGVSEGLYDSVCGFFPGRSVMLIIDESSRIKNPAAQRTQRTINFRDAAKYKIILNGTPIALGMQDLWSQYEALDPNIIGSGDYWAFKTRYVEMGGYEQRQIVGYKNVEELMLLIEPYTVEVGKDVLSLPPKMMKQRYVSATPEQKQLLRLIKRGSDGDPNSPLIKVDNVLERVLRWRQVVGGWLPRMDSKTERVTLEPLKENPKMDDLFELIGDHFAGSKFIIWSTFIHELDHIAAELGKRYGSEAVSLYYGATDRDERSRIEDRYCNDGTLRFFVGNPATAGLGLTLVSGMHDIMVYYSGTNAYIDRAQSEDRSHRIGQHHTVTVVDITMEKTVDESIIAATAEKMGIEEYIMKRLATGADLQFEG